MKISDLGEFGLINKISNDMVFRKEGLIKGIGDDTAVLQVPGEKWVLMTTDMLVEEIHFSRRFASMQQIGWKAMAVNLSDIAAMGGLPTHASVAIGIPPEIGVEDIEEIYQGIRNAAREFKVNIVGGDTVKCPSTLVLNITMLGEIEQNKVIYRSGAKPGDIIFVSGSLGKSAAGLNLFLKESKIYSKNVCQLVKKAHLEPVPRVKQGLLLSESGLATAMDDISDGLASELHEICEASGTGFVIDYEKIPISEPTKKVALACETDPVDWALYGGEDFELVFTVNPDKVEAVFNLFREKGLELYQIGKITSSPEEFLLVKGLEKIQEIYPKGYNHFKE